MSRFVAIFAIHYIDYSIMKQKVWFLLLIFSISAMTMAHAQESEGDVFEKITDIEKLLQQNNKGTEPVGTNNDTFRVSGTVPQINDGGPIYRKLFTGTTSGDSTYQRRENGTLILPEDSLKREFASNLGFVDTIIVNPLFLPMIFNGKILPDDLSFYPHAESSKLYKGVLVPESKTFAPELANSEFVRKTRLDFYRNHPDKVRFSTHSFDNLPTAASDSDVIETFNPFKELISTETSFSLTAPVVDGVKFGRKYWVNSGDHALQFSQSYFSPNWHKGGTGNLTILNNHTLRFNYKKNKVRFNNTFELRLSAITTPDDTLRSHRIADDLLRYNGDYGVDAFGKHWSYSTNIDVRTQMFNNYPTNSTVLQSAFLAPLYVSGGIGLKYNLDRKSEKVRHRRVRLSFNFDPASFSYRYVGNEDVNVKRYGIDEGKKSKFDFGSTVTGNLIYDFNRYINLNSRFRYFTSYQKVEAELENTLNMALTNAFSTRIYLNLRYDDKVPRDEKFGYLQVNELLSFGLNYRW